MRVLVTGANGFLGSHVSEVLAEKGHDLRLLLRKTSNTSFLHGLEFERAEGDIRDVQSLLRATEGVDAVIHLAALTTALREVDYAAVNGAGAANVAHAAAENGVKRFVFVSSLAAQGPSPDGSMTIPEVPRPISAYGRTKLIGERGILAESERMSTAILRLPAVYGPRDEAFLILFKAMKFRLMPLFGDGGNTISWIHARDAATATVALLDAKGLSGSVYTVSDGQPATWRQLATAAGEALGHKPIMINVPPALYAFAGSAAGLISSVTRRSLPLSPEKVLEMRQRYWVCDSARLAEETGWAPSLTTKAGVEDTVRWYREQGWL